MKLFWVLIAVLVLAAADDSSSTGQSNDGDDNGVDNDNDNGDAGAASDVEGRTRSSEAGKQQGRFFGGLGGLSPIGGVGAISPVGIGGISPVGGFGGISPVGGISPAGGFGGINPVGGLGVTPVVGGVGFGNKPTFGVNPIHGGGLGIGPGIGGIVSPVAPPSTCRYWCRTPEGQAYCCENINQPQSAAGVVKPGFCPPVRPVCPLRSFQPPFTCSNDGACGGIDKCCFDRCLGEHVCKPPLGIGR
nr:elastin-like [Penaeus vannamei]XP_027209441.1 elastin-like [Penaeus vannamei]